MRAKFRELAGHVLAPEASQVEKAVDAAKNGERAGADCADARSRNDRPFIGELISGREGGPESEHLASVREVDLWRK